MSEIYVVRAFFGNYIRQFIRGGYVAVGWMNNRDLSGIETTEKLTELYTEEHPEKTNGLVIGQQVGQIERFLWEIKSGDIVITPEKNSELIYYGIISSRAGYYYFRGVDGCPYRHRRRVGWVRRIIREKDYSEPFRRTIRSPQVVFHVPKDKNSIRIYEDELRFL
ncbi:MAG: hypothetical protein R2747_03670 [Pyrinomonadaceae bacterium]